MPLMDEHERGAVAMDIARKLGIMVFCGVPVIVGGGIVYALSGNSYIAVGIYEILLLILFGAFISK
jgi:hypothetical protein